MAKKRKENKDVDSELDFDDLSDIDTGGMDFGELENIDDSRTPGKLGVMTELGQEAGKGFLDSLVKETAKKSLPPEYGENVNQAMDYADFAKNTFDENKNKVNKSLYNLGKEVKKLLPFQSKLLDNFLQKQESEFEQFRQESEETLRENSIQTNLTSIFDKQLEIQKALETKRTAEKEVENRERITTNKLNYDMLSSIDNNTASQTAFTLQISKEYFRKSLELQYKSYFVQADMLKTMKDYYKGFSVQFENIQKNTGLPEFVKLNNTERIQDVIRTQMTQNTYKALFTNNKYIDNVKARAKKLVDDKVSSVTDKLDAATDQLSMLNSAGEMGGGSSLGLIGNVASGIFGNTLGEKLASKISPKFKDKIKDNKYINTGANYMGMLGSSPSTLFGLLKDKANKAKENNQDESSPLSFIKSRMFGGLSELLNVTDPGKENFEVKGQSLLNHNKPAMFDNKVHRSITEVIPMYLSKILKENTDVRQMYFMVNQKKLISDRKPSFKEAEDLHYDYEGRGLVTAGQLKTNVEDSILKSDRSKNKVAGTSNAIISSTLSELSKDKTGNKDKIKLLSDKNTEKLLTNYLDNVNKMDSIKFDYNTVIENAALGEGPSELKALLAGNPKLITLLETIKETNKPPVNVNDKFSDVKRRYPTYAVKELIKGTSKIADKKTYNVIKDNQAEILAKVFSSYIINSGKDIGISNTVTGEVFRGFSSKDFNEVKDVLSIFISEVKTIQSIDDFYKESNLTILFGLVNRSLKDNFELDPEVYQTLYEYSPILGNKGSLTVENLVERRIGMSTANDPVNVEDIRAVVRASRADVAAKKETIVVSEVTSSFTKYLSGLSEDINNVKNPLQLAKLITSRLSEASDGLKSIAKSKYDQTAKELEDLKTSLGKLTDETVDKSISLLEGKLTKTITSIEEMIKTEMKTRDEELKNLNEAKGKMSELINDQTALNSIDRDIKRTTNYYKTSIVTLEKLTTTLKTQRDNLTRLRSEGISDKTQLVTRVRSEITQTLTKVKDLLDTYRRKEDALSV
jgi:hypothetical protein